jgi:tetratricopeptide (TPR) repeat protein
MATRFSSEGFDLDAMPSSDDGAAKEDVVYEVGGIATMETAQANSKDKDDGTKEVSPIAKSEELKAQGNEEFKQQNFLEAYDMYTAAIEACPGMLGEELLQLRDEHDEKERQKLYERNRLDNEAQRRRHQQAEGDEEETTTTTEESNGKKDEAQKPEEFKAPPHTYGEKLAIYHNNRAACSLHLKLYNDAAKDCDIAILLNPLYSKAYVRRSLAYEKLDKTELALVDAKKALELDPKNASLQKTVARLQKIEDERLEKLKEETIGKLKDLGNSILGNFGLSIDNFKTVQDPNTGSYSIQFDNSKN